MAVSDSNGAADGVNVNEHSFQRLADILSESRNIRLPKDAINSESSNTLEQLSAVAHYLSSNGHSREADTLKDVISLCHAATDFGGLGLESGAASVTSDDSNEILFLVSAWMEALNSADRSKTATECLESRPEGRRGMTAGEKIFAAHDISGKGEVKPGDMIIVDVDWIIASELSWSGMETMYEEVGQPGIFRNDRFWIAGDHVVDPRVLDNPKIKKLVDSSENARRIFKMTEYQGMNYTIMHTEFFRERAQPGMLVIGSDSHTCSSGALGCLAIGLGVQDVTMPLICGETWIKVPETINVRLLGNPGPGIGGKDVILHILMKLKRNTVASDRIVEFTGPGLEHLSCDARFAIANMTTEFGGVTGIFVPDQQTHDFVEKRKLPKYKKESRYFRPDKDAVYVETFEIDLGDVEPTIAVCPSPDNVKPVSELEGQHLDGCFIGACTTAEEDLILGALILEQGLKQGKVPVKKGTRKIVPGSMPILNKLHKNGLAQIYEKASFEIGIPGCSYCVGMSADKAGAGEIWLSSQNRNFENRMGKGSTGHIASAVTVAASSFNMKITNPQDLIHLIDQERLAKLLGRPPSGTTLPKYIREQSVRYVEPASSSSTSEPREAEEPNKSTEESGETKETKADPIRHGKIQRLGDFIDTDAMAPNDQIMNAKTPEEFGAHCLEYTHPDFRQRAKDGFNVVVAGKAWGCGSSRDIAVTALRGAGIQCVIARSFAFIYARNQPNLGLLGFTIEDPEFYEKANDGADISIDTNRGVVSVGGSEFGFELSSMEKDLISSGGISEAFQKFGKSVFEILCAPKGDVPKKVTKRQEDSGGSADLNW